MQHVQVVDLAIRNISKQKLYMYSLDWLGVWSVKQTVSVEGMLRSPVRKLSLSGDVLWALKFNLTMISRERVFLN